MQNTLLPISIEIVGQPCSGENLFWVSLVKIAVLPTSESPRRMILWVIFYCFEENPCGCILFFIDDVTANSRLVSGSFVDSLTPPSNDFITITEWSGVWIYSRVVFVKVEIVWILLLSNIGVCGDWRCGNRCCWGFYRPDNGWSWIL